MRDQKSWSGWVIALVVIAVGGVGFSLPFLLGRRDKPNLLLITLDTVRADHLGCYGARGVATPALDALAARGVRFAQAATVCPLTLPSHVSLMTGLLPESHGVRANADYRFAGGVATLAETLQRNGYKTAAVVAAYPLHRQFGLDRGFDDYDDRFKESPVLSGPGATIGEVERDATEVSVRAARWLEAQPRRPFFLWVHYYDAHDPYRPPPTFASRHPEEPYAGEVEYVDAELGKLLATLERLGLDKRTLVIAVGDHGEGLGEHGEDTHGFFLYQSTLRVPFIAAYPHSLPPGRVVATPVSTVDVKPTILAVLGIPGDAGGAGHSLLPAIAGDDDGGDCYAETLYPHLTLGLGRLKSLRRGSLKYIRGPKPELYDLALDPGETRDLLGQRADDARRLDASLVAAVQRSAQAPLAAPPAASMPEEAREKLASLGYLSGTPAAEGRAAELDLSGESPMDHAPTIHDMQRAMALTSAGSLDEAAALLTRLTAEGPRNAAARLHLGRVEMARGRLEAAAAAFAAAADMNPASLAALDNLSDVDMRRNRFADAAAHAAQLLALDPEHAGAWLRRGMALARLAHDDEARACFAKSIEIAPGKAEAYLYLAELETERGRTARAVQLYEQAARLLPQSAKLRDRLAALKAQAARQ